MQRHLNDTLVRNAKPDGKPCLDIFDLACPGLCLRVTKSKKSWGFVFTPPGKTTRTRMSLGTYDAGTSLEEARERARAARKAVEGGTDPSVVVVVTPDKTIAELIQDYKHHKLTPKGKPPLRTAAEIMRRFTRDVIPYVGHVTVKEFEVCHLNLVIDPIDDRECFVMANRVFADMKALLKFGVRRGEMKYSPLAELEPPHDETSKTRFLSLVEIQHFWSACPQALIRSPKVQMILKLCLATGKRSNEICGALRSEIDWGQRLWTIPKERVKGQEKSVTAEIVPLSDLALALFQDAARRSNSPYLFPDDDNDGPYQPRVVSKAVKLALARNDKMPLGRLGMAKWTPHDLRRTVGTQILAKANGLGVTKEQKYLVLNHASEIRQNVSDRVYDMNDYTEEKREALDKWGTFLAKLVGEDAGLRVAA